MRAAPASVVAARSARPLEGQASGLLSVGELQQALRIARQRSSPEAEPRQPIGADADDDPEPDFFADELSDGTVVDDTRDSRVVGRSRRAKSCRSEAGRGLVLRGARRILGMDREAKRSSGRGDADWLTEFETPAVAEKPTAQVKPTGVTSPDVRVSDAPRGFVAVFWRWVARIAVAVLLLAGVNQVFVRPFRTSAPTTAPGGIDLAAAGQVAARFVADYLTHDPSKGDPASVAGTAVLPTGWSGTGRLSTDLVQPGSMVRQDHARVLVSVTARIAMQSAPTTSQMSTPSSPVSSASPTSGVPADRWMTLVVPVEATGGGLRVSGGGPIFTGEPPAGVTPVADGQPDSTTTAATAGIAATFLAAYARSDVSYLVSPGVTLAGLNNAVRFVSLSGWTVTTPAPKPSTQTSSPPTSGVGSGTVIWQLTGTDLRIAQRYSIALTSSQGRSYVAAVSPSSSGQES